MEADKIVSACLSTLNEQKTQQEQVLLGLLCAFRALKDELGNVPTNSELESSTDLRTTHIDQLKMTMDGLEREKSQRKREVQMLLPEILRMCDEMKEDVPDGLEDIGSGAVDAPVNADFVSSLKQLHERLHNLKQSRLKQLEQLRAAIASLYAQLRLPPLELEQFMLTVQTPEARCIRECQEQREKLIKMKRERGHELIEMSLGRIQELWTALGFGEDKRQLPSEVVRYLMDTDPEAEEDDGLVDRIFQLCEAEVDKLMALQRELRPILHHIQERERLLKAREEFRSKEQDQDRLHRATATQMLEEEKKRRVFEKTLPQLEKTLAAMLRKWNEVHHERLMYDGVDYLQKMEDDARADKERIEARKKRRAIERLRAMEERAGLDPDDEVLKAYSSTLGNNKNLMGQTFSSTMKMVHNPQREENPHRLDKTLPSRRGVANEENVPPATDLERTLPARNKERGVKREGQPLSAIANPPQRQRTGLFQCHHCSVLVFTVSCLFFFYCHRLDPSSIVVRRAFA